MISFLTPLSMSVLMQEADIEDKDILCSIQVCKDPTVTDALLWPSPLHNTFLCP